MKNGNEEKETKLKYKVYTVEDRDKAQDSEGDITDIVDMLTAWLIRMYNEKRSNEIGVENKNP